MSQRSFTIDDHSGDIISQDIEATRTGVELARNGHVITWSDVNLSQDAWDQLIKLVTDFMPEVTPADNQADQDPDQLAPSVAERAELPLGAIVTPPEPVAVPAPKAAPAAPLTQAEQRARSKAVRTWWYALTDDSCEALGLKVPNRKTQIGKLPENVLEAYAQAHSS
jgi:hypothetical protein